MELFEGLPSVKIKAMIKIAESCRRFCHDVQPMGDQTAVCVVQYPLPGIDRLLIRARVCSCAGFPAQCGLHSEIFPNRCAHWSQQALYPNVF